MTVTLRTKDGATSIEVVSSNDQLAGEQGMKPAAGKARLVLGNASENEVVITIAGRDYKLAAGIGADDPSQAVKPSDFNFWHKLFMGSFLIM